LQGLLPTTRSRGRLGERGVGLLGIIIIAFLALFGLAAVSAISFKFLLAVLIITTIGLGVVGALMFKVDFKYVVILALVCLGIVVFMEVTAPVIVGILVVALAMWKLSPAKQPALFVGLIGVGLIMVVWGTKLAIEVLGIVP
jgi:hypothetical protein